MSDASRRLLLLGGSGQVGSALAAAARHVYEIDAPSSQRLPLDRPDVLTSYIETTRPAVIVNTAAFTRVDDAESHPDIAHAINGTAPGVIADTARTIGARFVHMSTDYVFDGTGDLPYHVDALAHPLNVYGSSKLAGELAVHAANTQAGVVRTSWVHSGSGVNFIGAAVRMLLAGTSMRVVNDQVGTPTRATTLAEAIMRLLDLEDISGMHHITDSGVASWYDVACCVLETLRRERAIAGGVLVTPVRTSEFPRPARRPRVSLLDSRDSCERIRFTPPHWREGVVASTMEWWATLSGDSRNA